MAGVVTPFAKVQEGSEEEEEEDISNSDEVDRGKGQGRLKTGESTIEDDMEEELLADLNEDIHK